MNRTLTLFLLLCSVAAAAQQAFTADTISDALFLRMVGRSYPQGCTVSRSQLRHLHVLHYDAQGRVHQGEIVCNSLIADDLKDIFLQLYRAHYPIERIRLIDDYDADDERSMQANNTSCFCCRNVAGTSKLSKHAQGLAIDINPLYNPCVRTLKGGRTTIEPRTAAQWADRRRSSPYKISQGDLCYRLFTAHGFTWGGSWRTLKDYQHFEK